MARYGKTLREEDKGRDAWSFLHFMYRPLQLDGDTPRDRLRLLVVYVLLGIALILLISGHWIVALLLFVSVIVVWAVSGLADLSTKMATGADMESPVKQCGFGKDVP